MQDDRAERLITHYVAGAWRVPFGTRMAPAWAPDGARAGTLVLAEAADVARAVSAAQAALPGWAAADRMAARGALLAEVARHLPEILPPEATARLLERPPRPVQAAAGVTALLWHPAVPPAAALRAALRWLSAGATLVALPCGPGGTAAHDLAQAAHLAGLPAGVVNLLPGDAAAAAALASHPGVGRVLRFRARAG